MRKFITFFLFTFSLHLLPAQETRLLRDPDISSTKIVFAYANDLWTVDKAGGSAQRLTSFPGVETSPKFSADGKWIAFTGQYQGNPDVFVVPVAGGTPKRLTWHPNADIVCGWSNDGKVVFTSDRESAPGGNTKLWKIGLNDALPQALPMPRASRGSYSPDGKSFAYELNIRWDVEWRNYRGGQNKPIWILDLQNYGLKKIPFTNSHDMEPIWMGNKIYFLSDRDLGMNVWSYDTQDEKVEQLTFLSDYDIKNLSGSNNMLIYEYGGDLYTLDPLTKNSKKLSIEVKGDFSWAEPKWINAASILTNASLSPSGQRALSEARGEIITIPLKKGDARNITNSPGSREHDYGRRRI